MIITLCGSARFEPFFKMWNEYLTLAGHVVIGLSAYPSDKKGQKTWYTDEEKYMLDVVHKRKIAASDAIIVMNAFGYIGESTQSEIQFARVLDKNVFYMEDSLEGNIIQQHVAFDRYKLTGPVTSPLDTKTDCVDPTVFLQQLNPNTINRFVADRAAAYMPV